MLIRKISRSKWKDFTAHASGITDVGGDAVTGCLRTSKNTLSVWKINDDTDDEINEAILALITGCQQMKLSKIDFVLIDEAELTKYGLSLCQTPEAADTAVIDLVDRHFDITDITYNKLGIMKDIIHNNIQPKNLRSEKQLREILKSALNHGRIKIENLTHKYIEKEINVFEPYVDCTKIQKTETSYSVKCSP